MELEKNIAGLLRLVLVFAIFSCTPEEKENESISDIEKYREIRQEFLNKARPVIHNNDGCDAYLYPSDRNFSVSDFLSYRTKGLVGSDVSTISYCSITSSFGQFTHKTEVGEFLTLTHQRPGSRNVVPEFVKLGTDPLEVTGKYAHENGFEFFWSNRMNDCHDSGHTPENPYERFSKLKTEHPEYLFGACQEKLAHGRWSAVDFNRPEIRDLCVQYYTEVCENYDVDGIELDFFRHLYLFKEVARGATTTAAQLDMLTDMLRQIREMTERVGMKKGKPILILVRIPDSIDYCREIGIDIENWMRKRLVDIIVGSDYFRLNFWEYFVTLGHRYGVKVCAGLSEPRVNKEHPLLIRQQDPVYRARASAAWQAGVDGLYIFNEYDTRSRYLREIGSADKLTNKNSLYFLTYLNANPNSYLKNGNDHWNLPKLTPSNPVTLGSKPLKFLMETGDESLPARTALLLYIRGNNPESIEAYLNGVALNYLRSTADGLSVFEVPQGTGKSGKNELELKCASGQEGLTLLDVAILFCRDADDPKIKALAALCFRN
jgi:hypothetical protein